VVNDPQRAGRCGDEVGPRKLILCDRAAIARPTRPGRPEGRHDSEMRFPIAVGATLGLLICANFLANRVVPKLDIRHGVLTELLDSSGPATIRRISTQPGREQLALHDLQITESLSLTMIQASGAHSVRALIRHVRIAVLAAKRPWQICCLAVDDDGAVGLEHAPGPGDGLVGAAEPGLGRRRW
jgi:hypothetical protein